MKNWKETYCSKISIKIFLLFKVKILNAIFHNALALTKFIDKGNNKYITPHFKFCLHPRNLILC